MKDSKVMRGDGGSELAISASRAKASDRSLCCGHSKEESDRFDIIAGEIAEIRAELLAGMEYLKQYTSSTGLRV
jgi:hypothetical protein